MNDSAIQMPDHHPDRAVERAQSPERHAAGSVAAVAAAVVEGTHDAP